jgi:C1q domain
MKLKVVVVDLEIPPRMKRWGLRLGIPAVVLLGGGAIAYAAGLVTWSSGQTLQASDLNNNFSYLQGEIAALQGQAHPASAFRAELTNAVTIPNGVQAPYTTVPFNSVVFDLQSEYDPSSGTFTPKNSGTYLVTCALWYPGSSEGQYSAVISINGGGGLFYDATDLQTPGLPNSLVRPESTSILSLAAGDRVSCAAFQSTGVSQTLFGPNADHDNVFAAARLY